MTFKVGDKVKFLSDVGGGVVTKIKQQIAYVQNTDGFEIPTPFSELILVKSDGFAEIPPISAGSRVAAPQKVVNFPVISQVKPETIEVEEDETFGFNDEESITAENCTLNVLLGLVPVKLKGRSEPDFKLYLISDCSYRMMYTLSVVKDNFVYGRKAGLIEEDSKAQVLALTATELKTIQAVKIACIFYKKGIFLPHEPLLFEYKLDASKLFNASSWLENDYFDENAIIVNITEESLMYEIERVVSENEDKLIIQKKSKDTSIVKPIVPKSTSAKEMEEVDLHIEQLMDDFSDLNAGEIVDIQMSRFTIALEGAIRNQCKKIVFIHGVGNGKLKYEIRKALDTKFSKYKYQDASFKEYGYGATIVILK